jgi:hypothetical protein
MKTTPLLAFSANPYECQQKTTVKITERKVTSDHHMSLMMLEHITDDPCVQTLCSVLSGHPMPTDSRKQVLQSIRSRVKDHNCTRISLRDGLIMPYKSRNSASNISGPHPDYIRM